MKTEFESIKEGDLVWGGYGPELVVAVYDRPVGYMRVRYVKTFTGIKLQNYFFNQLSDYFRFSQSLAGQ